MCHFCVFTQVGLLWSLSPAHRSLVYKMWRLWLYLTSYVWRNYYKYFYLNLRNHNHGHHFSRFSRTSENPDLAVYNHSDFPHLLKLLAEIVPFCNEICNYTYLELYYWALFSSHASGYVLSGRAGTIFCDLSVRQTAFLKALALMWAHFTLLYLNNSLP